MARIDISTFVLPRDYGMEVSLSLLARGRHRRMKRVFRIVTISSGRKLSIFPPNVVGDVNPSDPDPFELSYCILYYQDSIVSTTVETSSPSVYDTRKSHRFQNLQHMFSMVHDRIRKAGD